MFGNTATGDKPFRPSKSQLLKVAVQTNTSPHKYQATVATLERQLKCADAKWRCFLRTLVVIEYLLQVGNEKCVDWATEKIDLIIALKKFDHGDEKARYKGRESIVPKPTSGPKLPSLTRKKQKSDMQQLRSCFCSLMGKDYSAEKE